MPKTNKKLIQKEINFKEIDKKKNSFELTQVKI